MVKGMVGKGNEYCIVQSQRVRMLLFGGSHSPTGLTLLEKRT